MTEEHELICTGMKCPRPIIEIAKLARKVAGGTIFTIKADDLAFESDVRAWVENAGATLLSLDTAGREITAKIQLKE
jgi:tRNA 2-thiouridine synthesizing protein A